MSQRQPIPIRPFSDPRRAVLARISEPSRALVRRTTLIYILACLIGLCGVAMLFGVPGVLGAAAVLVLCCALLEVAWSLDRTQQRIRELELDIEDWIDGGPPPGRTGRAAP